VGQTFFGHEPSGQFSIANQQAIFTFNGYVDLFNSYIGLSFFYDHHYHNHLFSASSCCSPLLFSAVVFVRSLLLFADVLLFSFLNGFSKDYSLKDGKAALPVDSTKKKFALIGYRISDATVEISVNGKPYYGIVIACIHTKI
jgi:hypothetical protein